MGEAAPMALQRFALSLMNIGMAGLVGLLVTQASVRRACPERAVRGGRALRTFFLASAALTVVGALLVLWAEAAAMAEVALPDAIPAVLQVLRKSYYGHTWLVGSAALVLLLCLAPIHLAPMPTTARGGWLVERLALAAVATFALTRSLVSHAAGGDSVVPLLIDWVHLLAVSLWAGEVFASATVTLRDTAPMGTTARRDIARYVGGLSTTATWALCAVVVTGAFSAWRGLNGSPGALLLHPHGQVLLVKLGLVGVAVAMGGYSRWAVMPNLLAALRSPSDLAQPHLIRFRTVLQLESLVLLGVLVVAAVLSTSEPPSAAP